MESPKKKKPSRVDDPLPLLDHLKELRTRLFVSCIAVIVCGIASYPAVDFVIADLSRPVLSTPQARLIFISPLEAAVSRIKIALFLGVLLSLPFVLFELWSFIQRGLLPKEKSLVLSLTLFSSLLFSVGAAFCYFVVLPAGTRFLLACGSEYLVPMISISRYLSFAFCLIFSFGFIFEIPLAAGFLAAIGLVHASDLRRARKAAVVVIFVVAAALTPGPDVFSQLLMAGPLLVLYETGIVVARLIEKRQRCSAGQ